MWQPSLLLHLSTLKPCCMLFWLKYSVHCDPSLHLGDMVLSFVDSTKFLDLIFTKTLTWRQLIHSLWTWCNLANNVLCMLSGTSWGADWVTLLQLYCALVRSVVDYGSIVHGCACVTKLSTPTLFIMLASVWQLVHFVPAILNFYSSILGNLSLSLSMCREILLCSYSAKISGFPNHPTYQSLLHPSINLPMLIVRYFLDLQVFI